MTRTIKLTEEQFALVQQALGIAERQFSTLHKQIIETTVNVRKFAGSEEQSKIANYYHVKACEFADLNIDLNYQKAIRFVQENYSPSMSYSKLAADLNLAGIKSLRGGVWSSTTARALVLSLSNLDV